MNKNRELEKLLFFDLNVIILGLLNILMGSYIVVNSVINWLNHDPFDDYTVGFVFIGVGVFVTNRMIKLRYEIKSKLNKMSDIVKVAEKLYYEANPGTNMDVPSFAYEQVEAANNRRIKANSELSLYDWCKEEMSKKNG